MNKSACIKATLKWCNERRWEKGLYPLNVLPLGKIADPQSCPCGEATGFFVGSVKYGNSVYAINPETGSGKMLPYEVEEFVRLFDAGKIPEYVLDSGPI
jgi:hypothetical protein